MKLQHKIYCIVCHKTLFNEHRLEDIVYDHNVVSHPLPKSITVEVKNNMVTVNERRAYGFCTDCYTQLDCV